jgi:hypothetical protein
MGAAKMVVVVVVVEIIRLKKKGFFCFHLLPMSTTAATFAAELPLEIKLIGEYVRLLVERETAMVRMMTMMPAASDDQQMRDEDDDDHVDEQQQQQQLYRVTGISLKLQDQEETYEMDKQDVKLLQNERMTSRMLVKCLLKSPAAGRFATVELSLHQRSSARLTLIYSEEYSAGCMVYYFHEAQVYYAVVGAAREAGGARAGQATPRSPFGIRERRKSYCVSRW